MNTMDPIKPLTKIKDLKTQYTFCEAIEQSGVNEKNKDTKELSSSSPASIRPLLGFLLIVLSLDGIKCTIDGTFAEFRVNDTINGDDPCNPLYWYPRHIPEYCNLRKMTTPTSAGPDLPIPIPIPVPIPPPLPIIPPPIMPPLIMPPHVMPPPVPSPPVMVPQPIMPLPMPLPFGIPLAPTNPMVPVAGIPLPPPMPPQAIPYPVPYPPPYPQPYSPSFPSANPAHYPSPYPSLYPSPRPVPPYSGIGMVPGIPGLVNPDGGINIMPFSDAYSDMLEKHKQKMIRKRLQKLLDKYDGYPWKSRRKTRRQNE